MSSDQLRQLLNYDPLTGVFTWKKAIGGRAVVGNVAGYEKQGYICITINSNRHYAHRLAVFYITGEWPKEEVDHINGTRNDNRYDNLRCVSHQTNTQNVRKARIDASSKIMGVAFKDGKWRAKISINGKTTHIGSYNSSKDAHNAYLEAKRKYHEGCTL
jgi:hypothetical protein